MKLNFNCTGDSFEIKGNRPETLLRGIAVMLLVSAFCAYLIYSVLTSPKLKEEILFAVLLFGALFVLLAFMFYNHIYVGLRDAKDICIKKEAGGYMIDNQKYSTSDIQKLVIYSVSTEYGRNHYTEALLLSQGRRKFLASQVEEQELMPFAIALEDFLGMKAVKESRFFLLR